MSGEVQAAVIQIQNNKSAERDNIKSGHIKYGIENIIKGYFNNLWRNYKNWKAPKWNQSRVIRAIQKPGKPKVPIENLRPTTLLSMLRKILAICLKKRIIYKLDAGIPPSQAA